MERRDDIPFLDGLRGLAALIVVAGHMANFGLLGWGGVAPVGIAKAGVFLFFLLGAFLLSRQLARAGEGAWTGAFLGRYAWRRVVRIYPLYALYLLAGVATTALAAQGVGFPHPFALDWAGLFAHLALMEGRSVAWSIVVEFKYYALLPLATLAMGLALARGAARLLGLTAALIAVSLALWPEAAANDLSLGPYLPVFLAGSALGVLDARGRRLAVPAAMGLALASALGLVALVVDLPGHLAGAPDPKAHHDAFLAHALLWGGLLLGLRHGPAGLRRPLESAAMRALGRISFSLYLGHMAVIALAVRLGAAAVPEVAWVPVLALAVALAWLSYRLVERPCLVLPVPWQRRLRPA